jgi:hypothetical protein
MTTNTYDYSGVTDELPAFATAFVGGSVAVILAGLSVAAVKWGVPQLIGLFKKTAR